MKPYSSAAEKESSNKKSGRRVLFGFLIFFMIFAIVDAFFVYKAINTHPGVVVEKGKFE